MMFPAVASLVLAHRSVMKRRGVGLGATLSFVVGYLAVWSLIGVIPLLAFLWFRDLAGEAAGAGWLPRVAGGVLILARRLPVHRVESIVPQGLPHAFDLRAHP